MKSLRITDGDSKLKGQPAAVMVMIEWVYIELFGLEPIVIEGLDKGGLNLV